MVTCTRNAAKLRLKLQEDLARLILTVLAQQKWFNACDLGRLEATGRKIKTWIEDGEIWKQICCHRWPNTLVLPGVVQCYGGYKTFYRQRSVSFVPPKESPALSPPKLKASNFLLLVDVTFGGEPACSLSVHGLQLDSLLRYGHASYAIDPFVIGKSRCWMGENGWNCVCKNARCQFGQDQYDARIHLISSAGGGTSCCVYESSRKEWSLSTTIPARIGDPEDGLYDWTGGALEVLTFRGAEHTEEFGLTLRDNPDSTEIQHRLGADFSFGFSINIAVIKPGDKVAIDGFTLTARCKELREDVTEWLIFDRAIAKETGVSVLHLIEQIQGLDSDDACLIGCRSDEHDEEDGSLSSVDCQVGTVDNFCSH